MDLRRKPNILLDKITVHGLLSFLPDVYGLFDPSGKMLWLSVDHRRLRPVDDMVLLGCVVGF